jgi:hypothetical protein
MALSSTSVDQLVRGRDYQRTWSLVDQADGSPLFGPSDALKLSIRTIQGDAETLALTTTPTGAGSKLANLDCATGEFDVLVKATDIETIATALGLADRTFGLCVVAVIVTDGASVHLPYAISTLDIAPEA